MNKENIKKIIASANVNFLIGAGLSFPCLDILGEIEKQLTEAREKQEDDTEIKKKYFEKSIMNNLKVLTDDEMDEECRKVLQCYEGFYKNINHIVLSRESSLLSKQINIFTTNIDIFSEMALEKTGIDFNDGFHGRFKPKYDVGNFKKSYYKTSLHYENTSEIPVFNILKLHGSVSWEKNKKNILLDRKLQKLKNVGYGDGFSDTNFDKLMIVNPTKEKFEDTILNQIYYDLLRIYSNELEKENSVLFVMGFSFADEHIKALTLRVANSNPTLKIYIFSYKTEKSTEYVELEKEKNKNVEIILSESENKYNFDGINKFFQKLLEYDIEDKNGSNE